MPLARFQRPTLPDPTGSLAALHPSLAVPRTFPDLISGFLGRTWCGLFLAGLAVIFTGITIGDHREGQFLVRHGESVTAVVTRVWITQEGRSSTTHVAVATDVLSSVELDKFDGTPRVGEQLEVLVDPRDDTWWEASTARGRAAEPTVLLDLMVVAAAAAVLLSLWLALWPVRLARRMRRAEDLHSVRGAVTSVQRIPGSRSSAPEWHVLVADPRGGAWRATLNARRWADMKEDALSLQGREVTLVLLGERWSRSSGALLVPTFSLPSRRPARWCHRFPQAVAPAETRAESSTHV